MGSLDVRIAFPAGDYTGRNVHGCTFRSADRAPSGILRYLETAKGCLRLGQWAKRILLTTPLGAHCTGVQSSTLDNFVSANNLTPKGVACTESWRVHVDDVIGYGDDTSSEVWGSAVVIFFSLGSAEEKPFTYRGRLALQHADGSIEVDMAAYRHSLQAVPIPRARQEQPDAPLTRYGSSTMACHARGSWSDLRHGFASESGR